MGIVVGAVVIVVMAVAVGMGVGFILGVVNSMQYGFMLHEIERDKNGHNDVA